LFSPQKLLRLLASLPPQSDFRAIIGDLVTNYISLYLTNFGKESEGVLEADVKITFQGKVIKYPELFFDFDL
jgi:hypothetical protein